MSNNPSVAVDGEWSNAIREIAFNGRSCPTTAAPEVYVEINHGWAATADGITNWAALAPHFRQCAAHRSCTEHANPGNARQPF
jgi:hypothetical protein